MEHDFRALDRGGEPNFFTEDDAESERNSANKPAIWAGVARHLGGKAAFWIGSALLTSRADPADLFRGRVDLAVDYARRAAHAAHMARPDLRDKRVKEEPMEECHARVRPERMRLVSVTTGPSTRARAIEVGRENERLSPWGARRFRARRWLRAYGGKTLITLGLLLYLVLILSVLP